MLGDTVWVVRIEHEYGDDIIVYGSQESADEHVYRYVQEYWDSDGPGGQDDPIPTDRDDAVSQYFDFQDYEFYGIHERQVVA
jgi:hypothetical protein